MACRGVVSLLAVTHAQWYGAASVARLLREVCISRTLLCDASSMHAHYSIMFRSAASSKLPCGKNHLAIAERCVAACCAIQDPSSALNDPTKVEA
jgi:hypothetical protein